MKKRKLACILLATILIISTMLGKAIGNFIRQKDLTNRVIVVAGENWHEGVLGIAAAKIAGFTFPSRLGGVVITTSGQPAIFAGIASIKTVDG